MKFKICILCGLHYLRVCSNCMRDDEGAVHRSFICVKGQFTPK